MRSIGPVIVFLTVAAFHSALSASLESAVKEETAAHNDGLTELLKIDQMEFEAAQKNEAAEMNVTEDQSQDVHYLEAAQDESEEERVEFADEDNTEGGGNSDAAAQEESESESSEEADGRQRREHQEAVTETVSSLDEVSQDSTKEQDVLE
ncbi:myelin transcription factor 1-like protein isoform X2 [Hippoglossus hippoglossus]|uniref:myelin transcription factor 1-like protein isoform X2 n=1 Tax=Hippoglossus hippoglossus TaxID=8267 RepID=UPI00148E61CC|nr:myelin transcription factor 1-like protein isoform X2 [Hippoglossus hippoglossus]XP_035040470.1 myelin transcription factor 1-like protein isoform X2 [Hippoglossus stenolepis]